MKIRQVCPGYSPAIGRMEDHVRNMSERLAREHKVIVDVTDTSGNINQRGPKI